MVRTKADSCPAAARKVVAARAPRKSLGSSSSPAASSSSSDGASPAGKNKYGGGNPVCPRPTPDWQKGIGSFLVQKPGNKENEGPQEGAGCSGSSSSSSTAGECRAGSSSGAGCSSSGSVIAGPSAVSMDDEDDENS